jgi:hypothetical protein
VVHPRTETLEIRQRFGVALPSLLGVTPDNFFEAGVLSGRARKFVGGQVQAVGSLR